jgi:hypothetical protein
MADFALWAIACETALWPAGTFARAYTGNRKGAIEGMIDTGPVAACVRELMNERSSWTGSPADLLWISVARTNQTGDITGFPKNPRARRPLAPGADLSSDARHRDYLQS